MISVYLANITVIRDYDPTKRSGTHSFTRWERPPNGEKIGEFSTRELAFRAMNDYIKSVSDRIPAESNGLKYTFTKKRKDGLYVAYYDKGICKKGLTKMLRNSCVEFILLYSSGGDR